MTKAYFRIVLSVFLSLFLITSAYAANNPPALGTITPSSGTSLPNTTQVFTTTYSDPDGYRDIWKAYFNIQPRIGQNCLYGYYDRPANKLYLYNDDSTIPLGGYSPGSPNTIENSYVILNCASTSVSIKDNNTLSISWSVTFKPASSGKAYIMYLKVRDYAGCYANWSNKGTYEVNRPPVAVSLSPSSGIGQIDTPTTFTAVYKDPDGWQNIKDAYFLMSKSLYSDPSLCAYYDKANNRLYLRDDTGTKWRGGYQLGSSNLIQNSYVTLDCSRTTVSGNDDTLTINWVVTLKGCFTGVNKLYLCARDFLYAVTDWEMLGTYSIPNHAPVISFLAPTEGTLSLNSPIRFTTIFQDADGYSAGDLQGVDVASDGIMTGVYSNGQLIPLFRVGLAKFLNN